jgi:hypothetical protein
MFGSIIAVIVAGVVNVGGIDVAFSVAADGDRIHFFDFSPVKMWRHLTTLGDSFEV